MAVEVEYLNANSINNINTNFQRTKEALIETLGRNGDLPNHMNADLDLNSNDILNGNLAEFQTIIVDGEDIRDLSGNKGWSPVFAGVDHSGDIVMQLIDYVGGGGTQPTDYIGWYIGPTGYVEDINNAVVFSSNGIVDGDKGDITVTGDGDTWTIDPNAITRPKLDDFNSSIHINVREYGAVGDGIVDDYAAMQDAIDAVQALGGGTVYVPHGNYKINTSLLITSDYITFLMEDSAQISHDTPDFMALRIEGDYCNVIGGINRGFVGPVAFDPADGATTPTYAVIKFTGEFGRVQDCRVKNIRRVGIQFKDVNNGTVTGCLIDGSLPAPVEPVTLTVHFGIHFDNGSEASNGNYKLTNNTIIACMTGCAIASYGAGGLAMGSVVSGNVFQTMWDHAIYSNYTDGLTVTANAFNDCHLAVAMSGPRNIITANTFVTPSPGASSLLDASGVSLRDPEYCVVSGNTFIGTAISGSAVCIDLGCFTKAIGNNIVADNTIRHVGAGTAIRITYRGQPYSVYSNRVEGNVVVATGTDGDGLIRIDGNPSGGNTANVVANNIVTVLGDGANGIYLAYCGTSIANDNLVGFETNAASAKTVASIVLFACNNLKVADNFTRVPAGFGTNMAVKGVNEIGGVSTRNEMRFNRAAISSVASGFSYSEIAPSGGANPPLAFYEGNGAPGLIAANGSQYTRLDGGAGSTFYVREAGAWVAK